MVMETLPSGTILHGRYRIERVLGSGGFGHYGLRLLRQRISMLNARKTIQNPDQAVFP